MWRWLLLTGIAVCMTAAAKPIVVVCQNPGYPLVERNAGYLGRYVDQPLYLDPDIDPANPYDMSMSQRNYELHQEEAIRYGFDGFVLFTGGWKRLGFIESGLKSPVKGFFSAPILDWWTHTLDANDEKAFEMSQQNPHGFMLDGRRAYFVFNADAHLTPEQIKKNRDYLEGKYGGNNILFTEICRMGNSGYRDTFDREGDLKPEQIAEFKEHVRKYLRVTEGIISGETHMQRYRDGELGRRVLNVKFLKRMFELVRETMAEPEFAGEKKYLAMQIVMGYECCYQHGSNVASDGTRTLRALLDLAKEIQPDVLKFSEWDEYNECTCIGPTLSNGYVTRRIIRTFLDEYRTGKVQMQAGDDPSVPNLVVSYRKTISPGEPLTIDVLNINDGTGKGKTRVAIRVVDEHGELVEQFPERELDATRTVDTRYLLKTERLTARALQVELKYCTADGQKGEVKEGFRPVDLALANSWDEKDVNHAIRDLPKFTRTCVAACESGEISAELECEEPIRYAMVEGGSEILYIHNPEDTIDRFRENADQVVFHVAFLSKLFVPVADRQFMLELPGIPEAEWYRDHALTKGEKFRPQWLSMYTEPVYVRIPRSKLAGAKLRVDLRGKEFGDVIVGEIPLEAAYSLGAYSLGAKGSTQVAVARLNRQAAYPRVWNKPTASFKVKPAADRNSMMYNVTVVTMSGKVWRSKPFCIGDAGRSRVLDYDFSPAAGDLVRPKNGERFFFGRLGDYFSAATLRNRGASTSAATHQILKSHEELGEMRPERALDADGEWNLVFDSKDDIVAFPWETIPRWAPWEVSFEFKPTDVKRRQQLFSTYRAFGHCSLFGVDIRDDRIVVGHCDFIGKNRDGWSSVTSPKGLLRANEWNTLRLRHTGAALELTVNGRTESQPSMKPGAYMSTAILGGHGDWRFGGAIRRFLVTQGDIRRSENFNQPKLGERRRQAKETLLYAEFLAKYGMFQDYLHYWIDRPLFWNRATRPEKFEFETRASFDIHGAQLEKAGLDGFNVFMTARRKELIARLDDWFAKSPRPHLNVVPIISYGEGADPRGPDVKGFAAAVSSIQQNPRATRINGKVLIPTYNYRLFKAEQHRKFYADLVKELGNEDFILCGDLNTSLLLRLQKSFHKNGALSVAETAELEQALREILDATSGLQLIATEKIRDADGPSMSLWDLSFFNYCTVPIVKKLLALPEYKDKVLGFYVHQGYINHMSGMNHSEEGTGTLRDNLDAVLALNPDYLIFFEWNEVNENTMFQPTVWGGETAGRILRWYSRFLKGLPPDVYPGDDASVPPLTLTYRATLKCGEPLHFELLNIPDNVWQKSMKVQLLLNDLNGKKIADFPVENMVPDKLGSIDYRIPTVAMRGGTVMVPSLVVDDKRYEGFSPIRIDPTVAWNYKTVRQTLRGMGLPKNVEASVTALGGGRYSYALKGDFGAKLASLELIANENEQTALGAEEVCDVTSNVVIKLTVLTPKNELVRDKDLKVVVEGATGCRFQPMMVANVNSGKLRILPDGSGFKVNTLFWSQQVSYLIEIPKTQADAARIHVTLEKAPDFWPANFEVAGIAEKGVASAVMGTKTAFRVDAERVYDLPMLPFRPGVSSVDWRGETELKVPYPAFHFRAITEEGKIWRSHPFCPDPIPAVECTYPVFDEVAKRPSTATAPKALMPELSYVFDPTCGAVLRNTFNPVYTGWLGSGFYYCEAYSDERAKVAPGPRDPKWVLEDGCWCLAFDGVNDYINFPKEAFPQAAFTITMEIKPEWAANAPMTVFRHFGWLRGSISIFLHEGKLYATWGDRDLRREPKFETGLAVNYGEWNTITVSYDFETFVFDVNGVEKRMPWRGRALTFRSSIFGGNDKRELSASKIPPVYYRGFLRRLEIRHW